MDVTVYYLEMLTPPAEAPAPPPRAGLTVLHAQRPGVAYYRFLYDTVGRAYNWYSRRVLPDAQLAAVLDDPATEVHVLHADGTPAGFVEFDRRAEGEVEIVQFGLMPWFIGQGLGRYFLRWAVDKAWSYGAAARVAAHLHGRPPEGAAELPRRGLRALQGDGAAAARMKRRASPRAASDAEKLLETRPHICDDLNRSARLCPAPRSA